MRMYVWRFVRPLIGVRRRRRRQAEPAGFVLAYADPERCAGPFLPLAPEDRVVAHAPPEGRYERGDIEHD